MRRPEYLHLHLGRSIVQRRPNGPLAQRKRAGMHHPIAHAFIYFFNELADVLGLICTVYMPPLRNRCLPLHPAKLRQCRAGPLMWRGLTANNHPNKSYFDKVQK